jgi:hypothetical protein
MGVHQVHPTYPLRPLEAKFPLGEIFPLRRTGCLQAQSPIPRGW